MVVLGIGLVFGGLLVIVLERQVLRRVSLLGTDMRQIADGHDPATRVNVIGQDEIADLATAINTTLESLQQAEQEQRRIRMQE